MGQDKRMPPFTGEKVEVDGVYENEWGGEAHLNRGDLFPSDPMLGHTEWTLTELNIENHHDGRTDPRLVPKANDTDISKARSSIRAAKWLGGRNNREDKSCFRSNDSCCLGAAFILCWLC